MEAKVDELAPTRPAKKGPDFMHDDYYDTKRRVMEQAEAADRNARMGPPPEPAVFGGPSPAKTGSPAESLPDVGVGDLETIGGGPDVDISEPTALKPISLDTMPEELRSDMSEGMQAYLRDLGFLAG